MNGYFPRQVMVLDVQENGKTSKCLVDKKVWDKGEGHPILLRFGHVKSDLSAEKLNEFISNLVEVINKGTAIEDTFTVKTVGEVLKELGEQTEL